MFKKMVERVEVAQNTSYRPTSPEHFYHFDDAFDALLVFGYGPVLRGGVPGIGKLNIFGQINAHAAGVVFLANKIRHLIVMGGRTGGEELPSEALLMQDVIERRFKTSRTAFVLEDKSQNTIQNLVNATNILHSLEFEKPKLILCGLGFHLPQIAEICRLLNIQGKLIPGESVVQMRSFHHYRLIYRLISKNEMMRREIRHQERMVRRLRETPEEWLGDFSKLNDPRRLDQVLQNKQIRAYLKKYGLKRETITPEELRKLTDRDKEN